MLKQLSLFDAPPRPIPAADPSVPKEARKRLSAQCRTILQRLRTGPATNRELSCMALRYTNRIQEIREAGYVVVLVDHNHKTGLTHYRLDYDLGAH